MNEMVKFVIEKKSRTARIHLIFGSVFAVTLIVFLLSGLFFGNKIGTLSFGFGCTILAMLVLAFLSSSRNLTNECARVQTLMLLKDDDLPKKLMEELGRDHSDGSSAALEALKEVLGRGRAD